MITLWLFKQLLDLSVRGGEKAIGMHCMRQLLCMVKYNVYVISILFLVFSTKFPITYCIKVISPIFLGVVNAGKKGRNVDTYSYMCAKGLCNAICVLFTTGSCGKA